MGRWVSITKQDFWGTILIIFGMALFLGHWMAERNLNVDHAIAWIAFACILLGAFFVVPSSMKEAAATFLPALPWSKKRQEETRE